MHELKRWTDIEAVRELLESFERHLPFLHASDLQEPMLAMKLQNMSNGYLEYLAELLMRSAVHAIKSEVEKITSETLDRINWQVPT